MLSNGGVRLIGLVYEGLVIVETEKVGQAHLKGHLCRKNRDPKFVGVH